MAHGREELALCQAGGLGPLLGRAERGDEVLVAVSRWTLRLSESGWGTTALTLPAGAWRDRITGTTHRGTVPAETLFGELPVALLERADG